MKKTWWMVVMATLAWAATAVAVPNLLQYQGRLTDAAGAPLNGAQTIVFSVYAAASGGSALYSESQSVTVSNGLFNVLIGGTTPIPATLFNGTDRFLGIKVGADAEMTPRQQVASVGYALRSAVAEASADVLWAVVKADGTILRQSGGFTVTKTGTGNYTVEHPNVNESTVGFIGSTFNAPGTGFDAVFVGCFANNATGFRVGTFLPGTPPLTAVDHDFSIMSATVQGTTGAPSVAPPVVRVDDQNRPAR